MRTKYWIISLILHLLLFLVLVWVNCPGDFSRLDQEFYVSMSSSMFMDRYPETGQMPGGGEPTPGHDVPQTPDKADLASALQTETISSPKYQDDLPLPEYAPQPAASSPAAGSPSAGQPRLTSQASTLPLPHAGKKLGLPRKTDSQGGDGSFFSVEGDLKNRLIINQSAPDPVHGLKEEVRVSFRLLVDGKGQVTEIIPIQKGDYRVETSSLKALKEWRFNPLPAAEKDSLQSGIITLIFKLQ
ncbi:MAG: hypothetical protein KBA26_00165 [Candidatus Delongbacteria bacterium]|nr:hypothetical protein [Candidatus Delongbacteria bacterium]